MSRRTDWGVDFGFIGRKYMPNTYTPTTKKGPTLNFEEFCLTPRPCSPKLGEANARAVASRELGSASLHLNGSGQPAGCGEASIGWEETTARTSRTPRGERRQRARKEPPGTWETRFGIQWGKPLTGSHNRWRGRTAVSDGLIVAVNSRSSREGAKEPWPGSSRVRGHWS